MLSLVLVKGFYDINMKSEKYRGITWTIESRRLTLFIEAMAFQENDEFDGLRKPCQPLCFQFVAVTRFSLRKAPSTAWAGSSQQISCNTTS